MNGRERFLRACRREPVDATPIWFMRQAGRFLPAYRALRKNHAILELAKTPNLSAQVTLMPLEVLDVDAAILFADIMLPLEAMGVDLTIEEKKGPVIQHPVRTEADVEALHRVRARRDLDFVMETLGILREKLKGEKALIGFSGAPFTLASYLIEGGPSKDFLHTKRFMHTQPEAWNLLLEKLSTVVADYLLEQVKAGADVVQLFDSWVGNVAPADYDAFVAPHSRRILDALKPSGAPRIHFGTGTAGLLPAMRAAGGDVLGVDWRIPIDDAWKRVGPDVAVQGNLDPAVLTTTPEATQRAAADILHRVGGRPGHIFNLGHGILPETPPENAAHLVNFVHAESQRLLREATL